MDLKTIRTQRGMTQAQLALKIGISQPQLAELENGFRPLSDPMAVKLASALGTQDVVLKQGHTVAAVKSILTRVAALSHDDIRAALKSLDAIQRDAAIEEPVRKSAERGLTQLAEQTTQALNEGGYLNDDLGRDSFGRARKSLDEIPRDLFGRRKKSPEGSSR